MWVFLGISAGIILGLYDFWTKKAMSDNSVLPVVFWSSLFGVLVWVPTFVPQAQQYGVFVDFSQTTLCEQLLILIKSIAMTGSWLLAYYSVRELPMSFSGAVRASGPLWTFAGGAVVFGEMLSATQALAVMVSVLSYYILSIAGKREGIMVIRSGPISMMLVATILSAMTTVFDKLLVQTFSMPIYAVQAYSAIDRCILSFFIFVLVGFRSKERYYGLNWFVPFVGVSWVVAEFVYFFAVADPDVNVTYLSVFRRTSLVVGFILSATLIGEKNVFTKTVVIALIILSTAVLIIER